jgi:hypothetical protein
MSKRVPPPNVFQQPTPASSTGFAARQSAHGATARVYQPPYGLSNLEMLVTAEIGEEAIALMWVLAV